MTLIMRDASGVPRTITELWVRDASNVLKEITELRVRDTNSVSRIIFSTTSPLSAVASEPIVFGSSFGTGTATTTSTTITPSGGTAPYTYAWSLLMTTGGVNPTAGGPTSATTNFTQTSLGPGEGVSSEWLCTVTDDDGNTTDVQVTANFQDYT